MNESTEKSTCTIKPAHWLVWSCLLIAALVFYPASISSNWTSNSDVHALFEFWSAFVALTAGLVIMIHFFANGSWLFLIISLGFVLQGGEDFIHAVFSFSRIWSEEQKDLIKFVPGTYATGRFILIACILSAWWLREKYTEERLRFRKSLLVVVIGIVASTFSTILMIKSHLPTFIIPGHIITRPVDFVIGLIYLATCLLYLKEFNKERYHTPFVFSVVCSLVLGVAAQIYMIHSQGLYDSQFDLAHIMKIFSYVCPILGIAVGTFSMYKQEAEHGKALALSVQKEKELAAAATAAADAEQQKAAELAVALQQLHESQQELSVAYQQVAANEKELRSANEQLKAKERALREAQQELMESVDDGFIVIDRDFRILAANHAYGRLCDNVGQNVIGRYCYDVFRHLDRPCFEIGEECPAREAFASGEPRTALHKEGIAEGKNLSIETRTYPMKNEKGEVVSVIEILVDVTEKLRLEEQLHQAQKMEAVGTLAGGIAHDFNNIVMAIIGYSELIKMNAEQDESQLLLVDQVLSAAQRAANLTQGLLAFSRKQIIRPKPVDLNDLVRNVEKLLRRIIGEDIEFTTRLNARELIVMADRGQIEQVLMNLATNARDAMPEGGNLVITSKEVELKEAFILAHGLEKPGRYGLITVSDTGSGMDEPTREKIFEPFFTTKGFGQGTGLGLSIVYGIVKQHNGHINCYSEPGSGTTFKVYIPLIAMDVDERGSEPQAQPRGGTETILFAEDDDDVRRLVVSSLTSFGYRVIVAADGEEALDRFLQHRDEVDMVILDVIMPKKSGREVYESIRVARPELRALFISGYTAEIIHKKGIFEEGLHFMSKPVSSVDLLRKVRELLDETR